MDDLAEGQPLPPPPAMTLPAHDRPLLLGPWMGPGEPLSLAEEVLGNALLGSAVLSYLWQDEAPQLCRASKACKGAVAEHAWEDFDTEWPYERSRIRGSLSVWRRCFPKARTANIQETRGVTDADFVHLKGVHKLNMSDCRQDSITDAAFVLLAGIHTLNMSWCRQDTITDAAFVHLAGIHTLDMSRCDQDTITDAAFVHLAGIHTLNMSWCFQDTITDAAFVHLVGIHTLNMTWCKQRTITDAAFVHLAGIHTLIVGCFRVSTR